MRTLGIAEMVQDEEISGDDEQDDDDEPRVNGGPHIQQPTTMNLISQEQSLPMQINERLSILE